MICNHTQFTGCNCIGPGNVTSFVNLYNTTVAKPNTPQNVDDAPAATLSTHLELFKFSTFNSYNSFPMNNSNTFAHHDGNLHGFATVASALDLHDPNNNFAPLNSFISANTLGLLFNTRHPTNNNLILEANKRFGFPHLNYPNNHYQVTPFDGVYNIGTNNGSYNNIPRPDNQLHVENAQEFIGDYLARTEVANEDLFLGNRTIGGTLIGPCATTGCYTAEFEARKKIVVGKNDFNNPTQSIYSINGFDNYLDTDGDFKISNGAKAIMHSGDDIDFHPGFSVDMGSELDAFILPYTWSNSLFRTTSHNNNQPYFQENNTIDIDNSLNDNAKSINSNSDNVLYPNPSNGNINITNFEKIKSIRVLDVQGRLLYSQENLKDKIIDFTFLENGVYIFEAIDSNLTSKLYKCIISR